jgi:hypothetical protein
MLNSSRCFGPARLGRFADFDHEKFPAFSQAERNLPLAETLLPGALLKTPQAAFSYKRAP